MLVPRSHSKRCALALAMLVASGGCETSQPETRAETRGSDCATCHVDEARAALSPSHEGEPFLDGCGGCHDELSWAPAARFEHVASFPLALGHDGPACASCHTESFAKGATSSACVDCHGKLASVVPEPVHAGLSESCFACHRTDTFRPARFVHAWPLSGVHKQAACSACHGVSPARYEGTSSACVSCHARDRAAADRSVSGHGSFPNDCESCHGFDSF